MRIIKFRGYEGRDQKWVYGYYYVFNGKHYIANEDEGVSKFPFPTPALYEVFPETVGQFTGLHDVNGKEIYEGDILQSVRDTEVKHYLHYDESDSCFRAKNIGSDIDCCATQYWIKIIAPKIVVGNIHENPELLKTRRP